ncbi:MAG: hypothetical protein ACRC78_03150 [Planktothrix sp.]
MMEIEFCNGSETHTSNWGKYYVKGLEKYAVKEDGGIYDRHHTYTNYFVCEAQKGIIFSIFEQNGDKRGTDDFIFSICEVSEETTDDRSAYGKGFCKGNFKVLATSGNSKTKAPRLMDWWINSDKTRDFALACAVQINKRGAKAAPV